MKEYFLKNPFPPESSGFGLEKFVEAFTHQ